MSRSSAPQGGHSLVFPCVAFACVVSYNCVLTLSCVLFYAFVRCCCALGLFCVRWSVLHFSPFSRTWLSFLSVLSHFLSPPLSPNISLAFRILLSSSPPRFCSSVARPGSYKPRESRASFYNGVAVRDSKKALSHEQMTAPMAADSIKHLEIPSDLMKEATEFRQQIEAMETEENKVVMVDTVQTIATQVGLLQRAAAHLKKDVRDVTALDVATYRLHEHEEFVSKVELDKVVLFSHEAELENFRAGVKTISSRYDDGKLPADIKKALDAAEAVLVQRAANQTVLEVPVSEELYQHTKQNLFPSFSKKVRTTARRNRGRERRQTPPFLSVSVTVSLCYKLTLTSLFQNSLPFVLVSRVSLLKSTWTLLEAQMVLLIPLPSTCAI